MNPLFAIQQWLASLPTYHRTELSLMVLMRMGDVQSLHDGYQTPEDSEATLKHWLSPDKINSHHATGKAVMFRAVVDLAMRNFFSDQSRLISQSEFESNIQTMVAHGNLELAERMRVASTQREFYDAQWGKIAASWKNLCETHLSDHALETYTQANPSNHLLSSLTVWPSTTMSIRYSPTFT